MIRLGFRCAPVNGRNDLAWLAALAGSLQTIHEFLLRTEVRARLATRARRALTPEEMQLVIDGRAIEIGSPLVHLSDTPPVVDLRARSSRPDTLVLLAPLLARGPELADWPGHVTRAWFGEGEASAKARRAHDWIRRHTVIQLLEPAERPKKKGRRSGDLPQGVYRAAPLQ